MHKELPGGRQPYTWASCTSCGNLTCRSSACQHAGREGKPRLGEKVRCPGYPCIEGPPSRLGSCNSVSVPVGSRAWASPPRNTTQRTSPRAPRSCGGRSCRRARRRLASLRRAWEETPQEGAPSPIPLNQRSCGVDALLLQLLLEYLLDHRLRHAETTCVLVEVLELLLYWPAPQKLVHLVG